MAAKHSVDDQYDNACQCARTRAISAMGRSAQGLLVPIAAAATAVTVAAVATAVSGERTREGPVFHPYAATGQEGADFHQSHGAHVSSQSGGSRECEHDTSQPVSQAASQPASQSVSHPASQPVSQPPSHVKCYYA